MWVAGQFESTESIEHTWAILTSDPAYWTKTVDFGENIYSAFISVAISSSLRWFAFSSE